MNYKERKTINKAIQTISLFLPKDSIGIWPTEIKKLPAKNGRCTLAAWDNTCGASMILGAEAKWEIASLYKKPDINFGTAQKEIYSALAEPEPNIDKDNDFSVCDLKEVVKVYPDIYRPFTFLSENGKYETVLLSSNDLLKLVAAAEFNKQDRVYLYSKQDIKTALNISCMLTFSLGNINVHLLAIEEN